MKPRIRRIRLPVGYPAWWKCTDGNFEGSGTTPSFAWEDYVRRKAGVRGYRLYPFCDVFVGEDAC